MIHTHDGQDPSEQFVGSGRQTIPLTGFRDLEPDDILGTASAPLVGVPLRILTPQDAQSDVTPVAESRLPLAPPLLASNVTPDTSLRRPTRIVPSPLEYGTPSHPSDRLRSGRSRFGTQHYGRPKRDTRRIGGHFLLVPTGLRCMLPTTVQSQGPARITTYPIAPVQTSPGPLEVSRPHSGLLPRRRPHPALHVTVVQPPRMRSIEV